MNEKKQNDFGSFGQMQELRAIFDQHVELLKQAYEILLKTKPKNHFVLAALLYSINNSCKSISIFTVNGKARDCFVLARTIYETAVNFCFICAKGKEAAEKARRHALQKSFRDLSRKFDIGNLKLQVEWQGKVDLSKNPDLENALKEFTYPNGRENTKWTPENIEQRIEVIDKKYGARVSGNLVFGFTTIYRHASEIAHGTFFGALFSIGLTSPSEKPKTSQGMKKFWGENIWNASPDAHCSFKFSSSCIVSGFLNG